MKNLWLVVAVVGIVLFPQLDVELMTDVSPIPTPDPPTGKKGIATLGEGGCISAACGDFEKLGARYIFGCGGSTLTTCEGTEPLYFFGIDTRIDGRDIPAGYSPWLLTINEPDHSEGCCAVTPQIAARLWRTMEQDYPDRKLIAPAILNIHTPGCFWQNTMPGMTCNWLEDFVYAYFVEYGTMPRIDGLGGHCYGYLGSGDLLTECTAMVEYLEGKLQAWGIDGGLWINEFGPNPWICHVEMKRQLAETVRYFESKASVRMYAVWALRTKTWELMNAMRCWSRDITPYGVIFRDTGRWQVYAPMVGR